MRRRCDISLLCILLHLEIVNNNGTSWRSPDLLKCSMPNESVWSLWFFHLATTREMLASHNFLYAEAVHLRGRVPLRPGDVSRCRRSCLCVRPRAADVRRLRQLPPEYAEAHARTRSGFQTGHGGRGPVQVSADLQLWQVRGVGRGTHRVGL